MAILAAVLGLWSRCQPLDRVSGLIDFKETVNVLGGVLALLVVVVAGFVLEVLRLAEPGHGLGGVHHRSHFIVAAFNFKFEF